MITFIAPFPSPGEVCEGWMSRIAAVDRIFAREPRVYVHLIDPDEPSADAQLPAPVRMSELVEVYRLDLSFMTHQQRLRELILQARLVYVHTLHWARYVIPFYSTGKLVTDIHGITPEEELLYGKPEVARFYEELERQVFAASGHAVVVTHAMAAHYRKKYPESRIELTVLPVFETSAARADARLGAELSAHERPRVLYSGGAQRWQKLDAMMELAAAQCERCEFTFLSADPAPFREAARRLGIENRIAIRSAKKDELAPLYLQADYGLVLREDIAVNRVACPTKLSEYLWFGVIPVVFSPALGDFPALGYRYVTFAQLLAGELPSAAERRRMMAENLAAIARLQEGFQAASEAILRLRDRVEKNAPEPLQYLSDYERNVVYPARSELQLIAANTSAPRQILQTHYAQPTRTLAFELDGAAGLAQLRFMPIDRQCQLRLRSLMLTDANGAAIPFSLSGNYAEKRGDLYTFRRRPPLLVLRIAPADRPQRLVAELEILRVGHELPPPVSALRERLRQMPRVVRTYQTAQALLRRFSPRSGKG